MVSTDMTRLPQVTAEVLLALDERRERDGVTLAEIARAVARPPSSVQRALAAMLRDGVVTATSPTGRCTGWPSPHRLRR
jgi:DNA-binding IclR family transcriptional regulator